jgi:hypothetical protein
MVDTAPKFEWRFVCYHEYEYYGVLVKNSWSKYSYMMIVFGENKPSKEWCHKQISKIEDEDMNKAEACLAKVRLKGELIKDAPDDVFTVVEISRTDDGECISFQQLNSSENKHDLVIEMHTYDIETGEEKFYEYEEKEEPGFFRKLLNFITG